MLHIPSTVMNKKQLNADKLYEQLATEVRATAATINPVIVLANEFRRCSYFLSAYKYSTDRKITQPLKRTAPTISTMTLLENAV